jgi:D-serine deaminase-like pyridoxal phosphate-dependent protein
MTPALAIYPEIVDANIAATLRVLGGDANRWRPHVKTSKLSFVMRRMVERGVVNVKCATTLELQTAAEAGATDILVAYPMVGANARRVRELAAAMPGKRISALVENPQQVESWVGSEVSLFVDLNGGMDRTGIEQDRADEIVELARRIEESGLVFRGLHYYDGDMSKYEDLATREVMAHQGYDHLMTIVEALNAARIVVEEVITAGTPAFPGTISYKPFEDAPFVHRASPGTVVYGDFTSAGQLPEEYGYRPAAVVVSAVVSHPTPGRITCDAGHKAVSADAGVPTCTVLGHPEYQPNKPSEEHLPIDIPEGAGMPAAGDYLYLVPRHVCPTVNNFDHALLVVNGKIAGVERVTARGREIPVRI